MGKQGKLYETRRRLQVGLLEMTSYEFMTKLYYFIVFKRRLNLNDPYYFNEKINWLKLNYYPDNPSVVQAADKFEVRQYLKKKNLEYLLNDLIGVWESWEEVKWDLLPNQFALKCTHGAQYNIIVEDKTKYDKHEVGKQMTKWLSEDFGKFNAEEHYSKIKPRIICERYLAENMTDYKFFCFNGIPKFFYVAEGFGKLENEKMDFFNLDGTKAPFRNPTYDSFNKEIKLPDKFEKMLDISKVLSEEFPFVRVDLFVLNNQIYFSELTFTPTAGFMTIEPNETYEMWGNYLDLSNLMDED